MEAELIPVLVIDDTPVKRRGVCEFVEETPQLELFARAGEPEGSITLIENLCTQKAGDNPTMMISHCEWVISTLQENRTLVISRISLVSSTAFLRLKVLQAIQVGALC